MSLEEQYPDFCTEMHNRTKIIHDQSDKLINRKLVVVLTDVKLWSEVIADFYFVFQTLESCLDQHTEHPYVKGLVPSKLLRRSLFEKDLQFYLGADWKGKVTPSNAATVYCDRILEVSQEDPTLLIGYAHSMYLAMLAGGQIIKRITKKTLGLDSSEGLAIFDIDVADKTQIRKQFKDHINALDLDRETKERIIKEKYKCFQMNNAIANNVKPTLKSYERLLKLIVLCVIILIFFAWFVSGLF